MTIRSRRPSSTEIQYTASEWVANRFTPPKSFSSQFPIGLSGALSSFSYSFSWLHTTLSTQNVRYKTFSSCLTEEHGALSPRSKNQIGLRSKLGSSAGGAPQYYRSQPNTVESFTSASASASKPNSSQTSEFNAFLGSASLSLEPHSLPTLSAANQGHPDHSLDVPSHQLSRTELESRVKALSVVAEQSRRRLDAFKEQLSCDPVSSDM